MSLLRPFFIPLRRLALALERFALVTDKTARSLQALEVVDVVVSRAITVARGIENRGENRKKLPIVAVQRSTFGAQLLTEVGTGDYLDR